MIPLGILGSALPSGPAPTFSYLGSGFVNAGALATQTIAALPFGTAAANRVIVAAIGTRVSSGRSLSSVTIGGVAATVDVVTGTWPTAIIARAVVPTGTSGDVVVTLSGAEPGPVNAFVFSTYGTVTVSATGQAYTASTATSTTSVSNAAGACLIAVAQTSSTTARTWTWANGLVADAFYSAANSSASATHANTIAAGPTSVSATSTGATFQGLAAVAYVIT